MTIRTWVNESMTNRGPQGGQTGANGYLSPQGMGLSWWYLQKIIVYKVIVKYSLKYKKTCPWVLIYAIRVQEIIHVIETLT